MFEKLLKSSDLLSPSVSKLLHKAGLPVGKVSLTTLSDSQDIPVCVCLEEKELLRLTNPEKIPVEASYRGPRERPVSKNE